jgi:hypothetical protein
MKLRFRTGEREVPDQLAERMQGIDVRRLTYDEAIEAANRKEFRDYVNNEQQKLVRQHMNMLRRGG